MTREAAPNAVSRTAATIELISAGDAALVSVTGAVDERFVGFGELGPITTLILEVAGLTRMTSFGVRQWLTAMAQLPASLEHVYVVGCPTFFVDQLNMVAHFIGRGRVVTAAAPYVCPQCGGDAVEVLDVLADHQTLAKAAPLRPCAQCGGRMELDESPEAYFAFCRELAATELVPEAADLLAAQGVYVAADVAAQGLRVDKHMRGTQTHVEISGPMGSAFRASPLLTGTTGEVFIHLEGVERFLPGAQREWRRLMQTLCGIANTIHVEDVPGSLLAVAVDSLVADNIVIDSIRAPYQCAGCGRIDQVRCSAKDPLGERSCSTCGAVARCRLAPQVIATLRSANARAVVAVPPSPQRNSLDAYEIIRRLATSPTADVFLATHTESGDTIALKRFHTAAVSPSTHLLERAARLQHPNIARVREVISTGTAVALALEYIHGKDLESVQQVLLARGEPIPLGDAVYIVREVARALVHARAALPDVDVSPALNEVMLSSEGEVKLLGVGTVSPRHATEPPRSDADVLYGLFEVLAAGQPAPIAWPARAQDVLDELGRVQRDPALESSPRHIAELVERTIATTQAPLVTDGAKVKIAEAPVRAKRSSKSTMQPPLRRSGSLSTPPPVRRPSGLSTPPPLRNLPAQRRSAPDSLINVVLVIAIIAVVVVGGYLILSKA